MSSHALGAMSKSGSHDIAARAPATGSARTPMTLQRAAVNPTVEPDAEFKVREALRTPGRPLDTGTRESMEPRFGYDFSNVRVHNDNVAAESARSVHASAYAVGRDIVFNEGQYTPGTPSGQARLAHELTHVVQQSSGPVEGTPVSDGLAVSHPGDRFEREASETAKTSHGAPIAVPETGGQGQVLAGSAATIPLIQVQRNVGDDLTAGGTEAGGVGSLLSGIGSLAALDPAKRSAAAAERSAAAAERSADIAADPPAAAPPTGGFLPTHWAPDDKFQIAAPKPKAAAKPEKGGKGKGAPKPVPDEEAQPGPEDKPPVALFTVQTTAGDVGTVNVIVRSAGKDIVGGYTENGDVDGYLGGTAGSNFGSTFRASGAKPNGDKAVLQMKFDGTNAGPHASKRIQRIRGVAKIDADGKLVGSSTLTAAGTGSSAKPGDPPVATLDVTTPPKKKEK